MPKLPTDYKRTIIYKIVCLDKTIEYTYVGSTTDFIQRKYGHKSFCNNEKDKKHNTKLYLTIRENGGWLNWNMIQIEEYPCDNKREAERREEYWRVELQANLNSIKAFGAETKKEYNKIFHEEHKEYYKEYYKKYNKENKDKIKECKKNYYEENKEYHKQYYKEHKEEMNKRQREQYQLKKQRLLENNI